MGLFGTLLGWDQNIASLNTCLASHLIDTVNPELNQKIATQIVNITLNVKGRMAGTPEEVLEELSHRSRVVQMQFVALACNSLGISPNIPRWHEAGFYRVGNPYRAEGWLTEDDIASAVSAIKKRYGLSIKWPGDSVKVDFAKLYYQGSLS